MTPTLTEAHSLQVGSNQNALWGLTTAALAAATTIEGAITITKIAAAATVITTNRAVTVTALQIEQQL